MHELYIYYRVKAADALPFLEAVGRLRKDIALLRPGMRMRMLRRDEVTGEPEHHTWMEIHDHPGQGIDAMAQQSIEALAARHLAGLIVGTRHVERFVGMD